MRSDLAAGLVALAVAAVYYYFAIDIPRSLLSDEVGADGLPKMYAITLALLGIWLVAQSLVLRAATAAPGDAGPGMGQHLRALGLLGLGVAYLLLVGGLGYFATICLLIAAVAVYCGAAFDVKLLATGAVGGIVFWLVFVKMFGILLPSGTLWQWLVR